MLQAQQAELERKEDAMARTTEKKVNFLQRLEQTDKNRAEDHKLMMSDKKQHWDDVRYR